MDLSLFAQSLALGIAVAAPVGPMSLLLMQRTLGHGRGQGLAFGAGIAAADGTYAAVAAFSLTAISSALMAATPWVKLGGSALLVVLGVGIMFSRPAAGASTPARLSFSNAFALGYVLTLMNPPTILFFIGIFAAIASLDSAGEAAVFSAGILAGSALWWVILTGLVARTAGRFTDRARAWINRASGAVLIGFAFYGVQS